MPSCNTYHLILVSFTLDVGYLSSKAQPVLLTLDERYLLTGAPPDLELGIAPLGPTAPLAAAAPWTWGYYSPPRR